MTLKCGKAIDLTKNPMIWTCLFHLTITNKTGLVERNIDTKHLDNQYILTLQHNMQGLFTNSNFILPKLKGKKINTFYTIEKTNKQ